MTKYFAIAFSLLLLASCKKDVIVFDGSPNDDLELPVVLKLNEKECFYDEANGLLKYSLSEDELENFSPYTQFQGNSTVLFEGAELKNNAANPLGNMELNKRYALDITSKGVTKHLQLEFTDIPMIRIVAFDNIANEPKTLAKMTLNYAEQNRKSTTDWIGIEWRGASSLSLAKKSYGFEVYSDKSTDHAVSCTYFDLKENSKWILDAMYVDKAHCRNKASFSLWSSMGEPSDHLSIRSVFVEVFLNNKSIGLYCLNENYSKEFLDLEDQSVLYKGLDNSDVTYFKKLPEQNPSAARWSDWEQKFPNPSKQIVWGDFKALSTLIVKGSDAEFTQSIGSRLDLDNVIDYHLFVNLCGGMDNIGKNWQFLKRSTSSKFVIVPWDLDATWGRNAVGDPQTANGEITNRLFERLKSLDPEGFNQRLNQRWNQLRANQFSEHNLLAIFADNFSTLNHYHIMETENSVWQQSFNLEQEQAFIESWITNRLIYLDQLFQ